MQEFITKITEKKHLTEHTIEISVDLTSPSDIVFKAGQFMQFKFGSVMRSYSIISVPTETNTKLAFCIELLEDGVGSEVLKNAHIGDEIIMRGPSGIFTFNQFDRNVFFVATGVGVAPFASIIPTAFSTGFNGNAHLLFGVRHEEDVFYFDRFNHMRSIYQNFKFTPMLSQPKSHWPGEVGRVTTYLDVAYEYYKDYLFYICGGIEMIKDTRSVLIKKGHNPKDIKLEIFV